MASSRQRPYGRCLKKRTGRSEPGPVRGNPLVALSLRVVVLRQLNLRVGFVQPAGKNRQPDKRVTSHRESETTSPAAPLLATTAGFCSHAKHGLKSQCLIVQQIHFRQIFGYQPGHVPLYQRLILNFSGLSLARRAARISFYLQATCTVATAYYAPAAEVNGNRGIFRSRCSPYSSKLNLGRSPEVPTNITAVRTLIIRAIYAENIRQIIQFKKRFTVNHLFNISAVEGALLNLVFIRLNVPSGFFFKHYGHMRHQR